MKNSSFENEEFQFLDIHTFISFLQQDHSINILPCQKILLMKKWYPGGKGLKNHKVSKITL